MVKMIQNEDSENDLAQQSEVARALNLNLELIRKNFWIETVRGKTGFEAVRIMWYMIKWWKAQLILLNPLSAYHDGDISKNADNVKFLYGQLTWNSMRQDPAYHSGKLRLHFHCPPEEEALFPTHWQQWSPKLKDFCS